MATAEIQTKHPAFSRMWRLKHRSILKVFLGTGKELFAFTRLLAAQPTAQCSNGQRD